MNVGETRAPGGFEDRLEAELVKVVTARAALPPRPRQRAAAALRRRAVLAGVLALGIAAAAAGFAEFGTGAGPVHIRTARSAWTPTPTARSA